MEVRKSACRSSLSSKLKTKSGYRLSKVNTCVTEGLHAWSFRSRRRRRTCSCPRSTVSLPTAPAYLAAYLPRKALLGVSLPQAVQLDRQPLHDQVLVEGPPAEESLPPLQHPERGAVDHDVLLLVLEADQLGQARVALDNDELTVGQEGELDRGQLILGEVEEGDVVAVEELDDLLVGDGFVEAAGKLSLAHAGKDALDGDLLVEGVVFEEVEFEVVGVAGWGNRY